MLNISICDDDLGFANRFKSALDSALKNRGITATIDVFSNAKSILEALAKSFYDIICLDIEIGSDNGVEVGNQIRDGQNNLKSQIVFISSHSSYHHKGQLYNSAPIAFIQKPFSKSDVEGLVDKALHRVFMSRKDNSIFSFEYKRKIYSVLKRDIVYVEVDANLMLRIIGQIQLDYSGNISVICKNGIIINERNEEK